MWVPSTIGNRKHINELRSDESFTDEEPRMSTEVKMSRTGAPWKTEHKNHRRCSSEGSGRGFWWLVTVISRGLWTARAPDLTPRDFHRLAHWKESLQNERKMLKENRRREDFEVPRNFFKRITGYVTCTASVSTCADSTLSILLCRQVDVIESDSSFLLRQSGNAWRWFMQFLLAVSKGRFTHKMPRPCRSPAMPCR